MRDEGIAAITAI